MAGHRTWWSTQMKVSLEPARTERSCGMTPTSWWRAASSQGWACEPEPPTSTSGASSSSFRVDFLLAAF